MEVKVKVNEQEVMGTLDAECLENICRANRYALMQCLIDSYAIEYANEYPSKSLDVDGYEDEFDALVNMITAPDSFDAIADIVVDGSLKKLVRESVDKIISKRFKFFEVSVQYEGSFSVWVKAKDGRQAMDYVNDMSIWELEDLLANFADDPYFTVDEVTAVSDHEPIHDDYIDARDF